MRAGDHAPADRAADRRARRIAAEAPLRDALALLVEAEGPLAVVDGQGNAVGGLTLETIRAVLGAPIAA